MNKDKTEITDQTIITRVEKMPEEAEKRAYILFLSGPLVGKLQQLKEGETTLGRAPDIEVPISDSRISRRHILITVTGDKTVLKDLGSTNGTFVNGKRIQTHELLDGDKIQLSSSTIFKFAYQDNLENIFHKELYKMAVLDAVTGIFNKRYFLDRLKEEFSHSKRTKNPISLLMVDIDHFKKINDTLGHLAGDFALAHLAQTLKQMVRTEDILARYGGEEFAVILRGTDEKGAWQLSERIRQAVEKSPAHFETTNIPMTISLGIASLTPAGEFKSEEDFIAAADHYLYQSKKAGRNRTSAK
ncbi:MAG: GGDEF domain-containing protein [Deltaproteobacteria bacterium]|nr:GGDEF domain-containing protein [Deltaproteobacteria bacterium]